MSENNCIIKRFKIKGTDNYIELLPSLNHKVAKINFSWGEINFRAYDGGSMTRETLIYMLRAAEDTLLRGNIYE